LNIKNSFIYGISSLLISFLKIYIINKSFGEGFLRDYTLYLPVIMFLVTVRQVFFDINKNLKKIMIDVLDFYFSIFFYILLIILLFFDTNQSIVVIFLIATIIESLLNVQVSKRKAFINYAMLLIRFFAVLSLALLPIQFYVFLLFFILPVMYFNDFKGMNFTLSSFKYNKNILPSTNLSFFSFIRDFSFTYFLQIIIPDGQYLNSYVFVKICQQGVGLFYQVMRVLDDIKRRIIYINIGKNKKYFLFLIILTLAVYSLQIINGLILFGIIIVLESLFAQLLIFLEKKPEIFLIFLNINALILISVINFIATSDYQNWFNVTMVSILNLILIFYWPRNKHFTKLR
jgi:hypothetical protein